MFIKPGASVFYIQIPVKTTTLNVEQNAYSLSLRLNSVLFDTSTLFLSEGGRFLNRESPKTVRDGNPGTFAMVSDTDNVIQIVFCPSSTLTRIGYDGLYRVFIRPAAVSRLNGLVFSVILIAGLYFLTFFDAHSNRLQKRKPLEAITVWINGGAGRTVFTLNKRLLNKLVHLSKQAIMKLNEPEFILQQVIIPCSLFSILSGIFALISSKHLQKGVTFYFLKQTSITLLVISVVFILILFLNTKRRQVSLRIVPESPDKFYFWQLFFLLFPLTPVVQYIANNLDVFLLIDSLVLICLVLILAAILVFVLPRLLASISSQKTLRAGGLALIYVIVNMASMSDRFHWFEKGNLLSQLLLFAVLFLITKITPDRLVSIFFLLNFLSAGIFNFASQGSSANAQPPINEEHWLVTAVQEHSEVKKPNVYLFVYDAYVSNETMSQYGIDNHKQEEYLIAEGFTLYPRVYSLGSSTLESMNIVLNLSTEISANPRQAVSGDGAVHQIFNELGYSCWGLFSSDYMFRGTTSHYDLSIPGSSLNNHLLEAVLTGEFRFDLGFKTQTHQDFQEKKTDLVNNLPSDPLFVYSHTNYPNHSQNSGACLDNEIDLYEQRLQIANEEMKQDISVLLKNDPHAIIIVAGDHGPYLTKNCVGLSGQYDYSEISRVDIQDRVGAFLAIRWPTDDYSEFNDIKILQDIFPVVFAYMTQDAEMLSANIRPTRTITNVISGVYVEDGIIHGGINDGEPLYLSAIE